MRDLSSKPRDLKLIDTLESFERIRFEGSVWRAVREGKDPVVGPRSGGRWDPGDFDVLYTSLEADGAIAEIDFVLSSLPVRPSKVRFVLHEIAVRANKIMQLFDINRLSDLGVDMSSFIRFDYQRTQEIGDAAYFLDSDGLIVPNARWQCNNLVLFTDRITPEALEVTKSLPVDFEEWRTKVKETLRGQRSARQVE